MTAILVFQLAAPGTSQSLQSGPGPVPAAGAINPGDPPEAVAAVRRPLFTPTRRPAGAGGTDATGPERLDDFKLAGSIQSGRGALAVLTLPNGSTATVRPGSTLLGWRVESIGAEGVRLRLGDSTRLLAAGGRPTPGAAPPRAFP